MKPSRGNSNTNLGAASKGEFVETVCMMAVVRRDIARILVVVRSILSTPHIWGSVPNRCVSNTAQTLLECSAWKLVNQNRMDVAVVV